MDDSKSEQFHTSKSEKESKISAENTPAFLKLARERARDGATYWKDNWEAAEDDLNFLAGEQWPDQVRTERELEQRPCLVNNVLPSFVDQVLGDQRQNKPSIKVSPVDMTRVKAPDQDDSKELKISSLAGSKDYSLAECLTGLVRNIEYNCDAETAYDMAFQAAVQSGMGFLRVLNDYTSDESFEQELKIKPIENQFSVIFDPGAKEHDYSDAGWVIIDDVMQKDDFKEQYPTASSEPVNTDVTTDMSGWFADNTVRVSEYIIRKAEVRVQVMMSDGRLLWKDEIEKVIDELNANGIEIVRERNVKTFCVLWHKITGANILEGPIKLDCTTIPVVPVFGKSISIKKKKIYLSLIRHSKDAQRMVNYWDSAATEAVALAPKAPFIGSEGHTEGREDEWENANTTNLSILTYVPQYQGDPGPRREQPSMVPAAELTMSSNATDKIKATLGMFDASIGNAGNETSGKAIVARQRQGDRGSFTYIDNLSKAISRIGKLLVEMIPKIYDTERVVRLKFQDDKEDYIKINEQIFDEQSGEWVTISDLGVVKYDVVVSTGPAYSTQRIEAAESMIQFAQAVPAAASVMADLIAQNMDWPGADVISERLKKIMPPNVLTEDERKEIADDMPEQSQPTPEQQIQMSELDARKIEAEARVETAKSNNEKSNAIIEKARADTLKAQLESADAQAQLDNINQGADMGDIAYQQVKEMVAQAIAEVMGSAQQ